MFALCLFVCQQDYATTLTTQQISTKFGRKVARVPRKNP